jgi:predicted PurR-regulated permease PerM
MPTDRPYRIAAALVAIAALFIILERLWNLALIFQDIILLFALAWLISFTLAPVIEWLERPYWPKFLYDRFYTRISPVAERRLFARGAAVAVVYLAMVFIITLGSSSIIPVAIAQGQQLSQQLPDLPNRILQLTDDLQAQFGRIGVNIDLPGVYQANIAPRLSEVGTSLLRNLLDVFTGVAATVSNLLLVIILSLYMNAGGQTLSNQFAGLIPRQYKREVLVFARSVNKTFGGFMRGQLIQALLVAIATALVMMLLQINAVVLGAILGGLLMLIPLIGAVLSILPPVVIALFQGSLTSALIAFILLFIFQQIVANVIMPKLLADSVGLHPLLVFAALLIGVRVGGIWGAFFGIPIAGVLYAMLIYFGGRLREQSAEQRIEGTEE